jgi:2-oxoglutarate ferredoxin oxidoreductase subunit delta
MTFTQINPKIKWNKDACKFCMLCVNFCPKKIIKIKDNQLSVEEGCIGCKMCEKYCPDMGIEVED